MKRIVTLIAFLTLLTTGLQAQIIDATNNSSHKHEKPIQDGFRKSGFTLRPELGFVYGVRTSNTFADGYYDNMNMIGATADLAIGYQLGSHFFFGAVIGYGGDYKLHRYYNDGYFSWDNENKSFSIIPLMADARWYIIDHKNTFVVDAQFGFDLNEAWHGSYILRVGAGFAFSNFETITGIQHFDYEGYYVTGFNIRVSYRFGNFKKWW